MAPFAEFNLVLKIRSGLTKKGADAISAQIDLRGYHDSGKLAFGNPKISYGEVEGYCAARLVLRLPRFDQNGVFYMSGVRKAWIHVLGVSKCKLQHARAATTNGV